MTRIQQRQDPQHLQSAQSLQTTGQAAQTGKASQVAQKGPAKEEEATGGADRAAAEQAIGGGTRTRRIPGVHIGLEDNGKTFDVKAGENIVLQLPGKAGTGYEWRIKTESRSLSKPTVDEYIPDHKGMVGGSGTQQLVWKTGPMSVGDGQSVELVYARAGQLDKKGNKSFTFTVNVKGEGEAPAPMPPIHGFVAPTHEQLLHFVTGRVEDALAHKTAKKMAHSPKGYTKGEHYDLTKDGAKKKVDAYVVDNHLYVKTQSLFPRKAPEWRDVGPMPLW